MAITLVTNVSQDLTAGSSTSAIDTTGANLLVAGQSYFSSVPTLADSKSNTWTFVQTNNYFGTAFLDSYYVSAPTVGSGHTFQTVTNASAISVGAFAGVATSSPLDGSVGNTVTGTTTIQAGNITPSVDNCLVVALLYYENDTPSISAGFTLLSNAVGGSGTAIAYQIQTTATTVNPTWTLSASNTRLDAQLIVFKPASGGGGGNDLSVGWIGEPVIGGSTF